jgi:hypothetical protein
MGSLEGVGTSGRAFRRLMRRRRAFVPDDVQRAEPELVGP